MSSKVLRNSTELGKSKKNDEVLGQKHLAMVGGGAEGCMTTFEQ